MQLHNRGINVLVLISAGLQLITPAFANFDQSGTFNDPEIIPATYAFGIWGLITGLAFIYAVYQLLPRRKNATLHDRLGRALFITYSLFSVWLFAADRQWLLLTVIIFVVMFGLLVLAFHEIISKQEQLTLVEKIVLEMQVALYTGWTTVAIFANIAACLKYYRFFVSYSSAAVVIQSIILIAALGCSLYCIVKFRGNKFYAAAILWAFVGIFVGLQQKSASNILKLVAVAGIVSIVSLMTWAIVKKPGFTRGSLQKIWR